MEFLSKEPTIKQAVLATLAYFNIFTIPLTRHELSEYLLLLPKDEHKIDIYLKESPLIKIEDGCFSLGINKADYSDKFSRSKKYWERVRRYHFLFSICPFIKLICVCNSLCINDTVENSDIDLLVITQQNRLFPARLFITLLTTLFGVRRHGDKIEKRFCLSFFVSEDNLDFSKIAIEPYDIYLAYWIKTLQPISGDYDIYGKLMLDNGTFLKKYFSHPPILKKRYFRKRDALTQHMKFFLEKIFGSEWFNYQTKKYQLKRALDKMRNLNDKSGTVINDGMLKFHDKDSRYRIRENWEALLKKIF